MVVGAQTGVFFTHEGRVPSATRSTSSAGS
jgi:hypothetical protein